MNVVKKANYLSLNNDTILLITEFATDTETFHYLSTNKYFYLLISEYALKRLYNIADYINRKMKAKITKRKTRIYFSKNFCVLSIKVSGIVNATEVFIISFIPYSFRNSPSIKEKRMIQ